MDTYCVLGAGAKYFTWIVSIGLPNNPARQLDRLNYSSENTWDGVSITASLMLGRRQWNVSGCGMTEALSAPVGFGLALALLPFAKRKASSTRSVGQGGWEAVEHTWTWPTASESSPSQSAHDLLTIRSEQQKQTFCIHVYAWLSPFAVHLKLSQHC